MRRLISSLSLWSALLGSLALVSCTEPTDKPSDLVGKPYPHPWDKDVVGSPYHSDESVEVRAGSQHDTLRMRGPSLVQAPTEAAAVNTTGAAPSAVEAGPAADKRAVGGVKQEVSGQGTTRGGTGNSPAK